MNSPHEICISLLDQLAKLVSDHKQFSDKALLALDFLLERVFVDALRILEASSDPSLELVEKVICSERPLQFFFRVHDVQELGKAYTCTRLFCSCPFYVSRIVLEGLEVRLCQHQVAAELCCMFGRVKEVYLGETEHALGRFQS